jgi:flagellin
MSLGVLNNLSAMSAANNLNNTNNALSKTLQQLSSGSKINSGADDAAGLSLVNGLGANATALAQSQTNATEGAGLLQVADGALSQVTNLLNRAVTLATEVSNGTLNSSQQSAANQEYQSILSEVNNIGSTTTYNQRQVFGSTTSIYTGDSSTTSASVDKLSISSLSSANMGDTSGVMSYSNGENNVFVDLSYNNGSTTKNAALTDTLTGGSNGTTSITVTYLTAGKNGAAVTNSATISSGAGTTYANTTQGMMDAINNSGLGLSATFGTATQGGSSATASASGAGGGAAAGTDTGIIISGANVSTGALPGVSDKISVANKVAGTSDTLSGTLTVVGSDSKSHSVTISAGNKNDTTATLASYINSQGWGVTATQTQDGTDANEYLTFASSSPNVAVTGGAGLTDSTGGAVTETLGSTGTSYYSIGLSSAGGVKDGSTNQGANGGLTADTNGTGGVATISYSASAGEDLSSTNLSSQSGAQSALTQLNSAIANVAAQDGYIGAQINTLNAVSSVMSTQQQNIVAAQNAVQATDYATAASNMSKYQILSQTGISALAQANSMQQEVTKLLQ